MENHNELLNSLINQIEKVDFRAEVNLKEGEKLEKKHYLIVASEELIRKAQGNSWNLIQHQGHLYLYNGAYWKSIDQKDFKVFLTKSVIKMGINEFDAKYFQFQDTLYSQFINTASLNRDGLGMSNEIMINLLNGTFIITPEKQELIDFRPTDFFKYQLDFCYDGEADAPLFMKYLDRVLPDKTAQDVLSEFTGYIFTRTKVLKMEKTLLLYGSGANGKSVFFDILMSLLGSENVSNYTLESLTDVSGYKRAMIGDKLVNYASEISKRLYTDTFKQLVSGEPLEARLPYKEPFIITDYAKLIFNCNELPKDIEQTYAFFRRFLILPFNVRIPEEEQDKELARKIIETELSGVLNWALNGLRRLLINKRFTECVSATEALDKFKIDSDSVKLFLKDSNMEKSTNSTTYLKDLYSRYKDYCKENMYKACSNKVFSERLRNMDFEFTRNKHGYYLNIEHVEDEALLEKEFEA
jgi:putative DNA primase/helicase